MPIGPSDKPIASELPETPYTWLGALCPATMLLLPTCCAHNSQIDSNKYYFSSFNNVDLLRSMSADCCMPWCREWCAMMAVGQRGPPWLVGACILPSFS